MNTNYQVFQKVEMEIIPGKFQKGFILFIDTIGLFPIKVYANGCFYSFRKNGTYKAFRAESNVKLKVIGHIGEDIAIAFANYCIGEGYTSNAKPENFQRFLETYKPLHNENQSK